MRVKDDIAGGVMTSVFIILVSATIATAAAVFERSLQKVGHCSSARHLDVSSPRRRGVKESDHAQTHHQDFPVDDCCLRGRVVECQSRSAIHINPEWRLRLLRHAGRGAERRL